MWVKLIRISLAPILLLGFAPVSAQEINYICFIQRANGRVINLTKLCERKVAVQPSIQQPQKPQLSEKELKKALELVGTAYADSYCEARAQGKTHRQASNDASSVAAEYFVRTGIPDDKLDVEWFQNANEKSKLLCPELQPKGRYT
ncbi:MAG TPA: hypothetical protein IGS53_15800 [Leptolyngbyaceae cyanobacterium M33_DOE_097]|uniref:DUF732 domain-containing protein n=1 Tax=Oscillatoriales cyanobacterium SpSt-418 TaxID=2282169 RepID=A0A7C3PGZ4_9CYAN|nr:hypothetical protein [Leptolyngbyaceae cyanobacterium M33_DOE_097]